MNIVQKRRLNFISLIFWTVILCSFIFFAFLLVLKANGFQLNYRTWRITKTGLIILAGEPRGANVRMNFQTLRGTLPVKISNLIEGDYEITVLARNYQEWQKVIHVEPGQTSNYPNILLFFQEPKDALVDEGLTLKALKKDANNLRQGVRIINSELYWQDQLVSRFSQEVLIAYIYPGKKHLLFQVEDELRIIDLDGSNNLLLFRLSSSEPTLVTFRENGAIVIFLEGEKIFARRIR